MCYSYYIKTLKSNPGSTLTAECTVGGGPADTTVWNGSVFNCVGNDITLIYVRFASSPIAAGECNNGSIVAQGISVKDDSYTSQLNINITPDMIGKTVSCVHDNVCLSAVTVVGTLTVATVGEI